MCFVCEKEYSNYMLSYTYELTVKQKDSTSSKATRKELIATLKASYWYSNKKKKQLAPLLKQY